MISTANIFHYYLGAYKNSNFFVVGFAKAKTSIQYIATPVHPCPRVIPYILYINFIYPLNTA